MSDEVSTPAVVTTAPIQESASSVAASPVITSPSVETVVAEAPAVIEAAPDPVVEAPKAAETILGSDEPTKVEPVKTDGAEVKQPEEAKKEEVSQSDEPAPLPSFEPWKLPEGIQVDESRMGEFNKELGEFARDAKIDSKLVQGLGQKLIERHVAEVQSVAEKVAEAYSKIWKDQTKSWHEQFVKDPEIGGNRQETSAASAREFIRKHGGTPEQQTELRTILDQTGLGNHPAVIRIFAKANANLAEGKMVPAGKPPAAQLTKTQKFYGKKS